MRSWWQWIKNYVFAETVFHLLGFKKRKRRWWKGRYRTGPRTPNELWALAWKGRATRRLEKQERERVKPLRDIPEERIKAEYNRREGLLSFQTGNSAYYVDGDIVGSGDPRLLWLQQMTADPDLFIIEDVFIDPLTVSKQMLEVWEKRGFVGFAAIDGRHYPYFQKPK